MRNMCSTASGGGSYNRPGDPSRNVPGTMGFVNAVALAITPSQEIPQAGPPRLERLTRTVRSKVRDNEKHIRNPTGSERPLPGQWQTAVKKLRDAYKYSQIRRDQVRLLIMKAGEGDDEINAVLQVVNDSNLGDDPFPYEALSYHWGEGETRHSIIIQEDWSANPIKSLDDLVLAKMAQEGRRMSRLYVRPNLHSALKRLRKPNTPVGLWVDALCIDQQNDMEKSEQVQKMNEIYRKAHMVCIWLGTDDPEFHSSKAMAFIKDVIQLENLDQLLNRDENLHKWASLFQLLKWSWFSRRWVIQELALAQEATVLCGQSEIHWDDFRDAIGIFDRYFKSLQPRLQDSKLISTSISDLDPLGAKLLVEMTSDLFRSNPDGEPEATMGLEKLVSRLASFSTSDPRDTINCLRNISRELNPSSSTKAIKLPPAPDYTQDLFEVYRDFVRWVIEQSGSLDIICRHWALREKTYQWDEGPTAAPRLVNLPSWILTAEDGSFGAGEAVFRGRKAGDSFVGLPGEGAYSASGDRTTAKVKTAEVKFGEYITDPSPVGDSTSKLPVPASTSVLGMSLTVRGYRIGVVDWRSDPIPDGVIPEGGLEKLGWTYAYRSQDNLPAPDQLCRTLVGGRGPNGTAVPTYYSRACLYCLRNETPNGHINTEKLLGSSGPGPKRTIVQDYMERVRAVTWNRVILQGTPTPVLPDTPTAGPSGGSGNLVGLGPPRTQVKDVIAILFGCSVPVILRPSQSDSSLPQLYKFIGEAYIYGKMDGEAMYEAHADTDFVLC